MSFSDLRFVVASDVLLACFLPLAILILSYKHFPSFALSDIRDLFAFSPRNRRRHGHFSLERAYYSFSQYARLSANELSRMRSSYATLSRTNRNIGYKIGYTKKLDHLRDVTSLNTVVVDGIVELALEEFPFLKDEPVINTDFADLGRVRESLKHFVRDWSEEGATERARIFTPIINLLSEVDAGQRGQMKVLVPGCGLGRLAWEISQLGFDTTANELSFFMTLSLRFLLSTKATTSVNDHQLRPYAHWFSHQRSNVSLFRCISFPDVVPRRSANFCLVEGDFLDIKIPTTGTKAKPLGWTKDHANAPGTQPEGFDYIVTLFFIDTSLDVLTTINHIYTLLRPGGTWINLGPLLWTGGAQAKVELSLDEVLNAAKDIGFILASEDNGPASRQTVECEYTGDKNAMMRWIYKAEFWVGRKPEHRPSGI
ncbi:N2227-domain-containing protein [Pholiota conissans]|uniref:N2227-domain-containing protein n=1 Tax=Pholiota conissans TaxID=109636 RepID=A0A9P5ZDJ1_9AGAR|nr:N2227-domain-containing protein [Pholiota conissans]